MSQISDIFEEYNRHTSTAKVNMKEYNKAVKALMEGSASEMHKFFNDLELNYDALDETAKKFGYTTGSLVEGLKNVEDGLASDSQVLRDIQSDLKGAETAAAGAATGFTKFGNVLKSIGKTVG